MKNKAELIFTFLKIPTDYAAITLAALTAWSIRFEESIQEIRPVIFDLTFNKYLTYVLMTAAVWLVFFVWSGLYEFKRTKITDLMARIILACSTGMMAIIVYMFFVRELFDSRFIVLSAWGLSMVFVIVGRLIIRKIQTITLGLGWGAHRVVLVGHDQDTEEILKTFQSQPGLGFRVVKQIASEEKINRETLMALHEKYKLDEIIQTDSTLSRGQSVFLLDFANENNIIFKYAAGQFEARTTNVEVQVYAGVPIVEIKKTKLDGWGKIIKRMIDFVLGLILLIVFSPLMLIIAILIKLEDSGPAIYKNERVHSKGTFMAYKFRSMYTKFCTGKQFSRYTDQKAVLEYEQKLIASKSERKGPLYKILDDPRRTKIGKFIESTSLDELPQLWNVVIGNMSLVGPRPHQPREVEKYEKHHKRVLDIKPGVSGLAQISGRSDLDFDEEVKLDRYYIENWSLGLDLWIILRTPLAIIKRKSKV